MKNARMSDVWSNRGLPGAASEKLPVMGIPGFWQRQQWLDCAGAFRGWVGRMEMWGRKKDRLVAGGRALDSAASCCVRTRRTGWGWERMPISMEKSLQEDPKTWRVEYVFVKKAGWRLPTSLDVDDVDDVEKKPAKETNGRAFPGVLLSSWRSGNP